MLKKYSKIRKTDEQVLNLFKEIEVVDDNGNSHKVPCIWADTARAAAYVCQAIKEEDNQTDKIRLPVISIYGDNISMNGSEPVIHYKVRASCLFQEDMNQIIEQILLKFDNTKNCKLAKIDLNKSPGKDSTIRVIHSDLEIYVEGIGVPVETHS